MTMRDDHRKSPRDSTHLLRKLDPHCAVALEAAASLCQARLAGEITAGHWLLKLIEAGDGDIPAILRRHEIDIDGVWGALLAAIDRVPRDLRDKPALSQSLARELESAWLHASTSDAAQPIRSANLLQAIVDAAPHSDFHWSKDDPLEEHGALASIVRRKIARIAERLRRRYDIALTANALPGAGHPVAATI
ncbi:hypothetical protein R69919_01983 [Paraburkholderia gardini]|nr:hypothetical protein R69919_01983 [Paraburkholderia gardini]